MPGLAELAALVVCAGSILAAAARDRGMGILGVTVALVAAPLVSHQIPELLPLAFREVAVLTGAYLLWIATGRDQATELRGDSAVAGGPFVLLGFVTALVLAPALGPDRGPLVGLAGAAAAGMAALALGIGATGLLAGGLGAIMLLLAASLAVTGLAGASGPLDHVVIGLALLAVTAATAFLGSPERPPVAVTAPAEQPNLVHDGGD